MNRRPLSPVDILSHDVYERAIPHAAFARLRRDMPVAWHPEPGDNAGFWAITRWEDLVAVHRDHETFSSQVGGTELEELERDPEAREARRTMLETDPPEHTRLRRMVSRNFTRRSMERWAGDRPGDHDERDTRRGAVDRRPKATVEPALEVEFVSAVARKLPILMISRILGVPDRRHRQPLRMGRSDHLPRRPRLLRGRLRQGGHRPVPPVAVPQPDISRGCSPTPSELADTKRRHPG